MNGLVSDGRLSRKQRRDALRRARCIENIGEALREFLYRLREQRGKLHERDQCAQRHALGGENNARAAPKQDRARTGRQRCHDGNINARQHCATHGPQVHLAGKQLKLGKIRLFAREGLGGARAEKHFSIRRSHRARHSTRFSTTANQVALKDDAERSHHGNGGERPQRKPRVGREHRGGNADENRAAPREVQDAPRHQPRNLRAIAGKSRYQPTRRAHIEVRGFEFL